MSRRLVDGLVDAEESMTTERLTQLADLHPRVVEVARWHSRVGWRQPNETFLAVLFHDAVIRQPTTDLVALDGPDATSVGVLLAASRTSDIADAHVVVCGRRSRQAIVTSDPDDLRRLDPTAALVTV